MSSLTADKFDQFFTSIASNLCSCFINSSLPRLLTERVEQEFALDEIDTDF